MPIDVRVDMSPIERAFDNIGRTQQLTIENERQKQRELRADQELAMRQETHGDERERAFFGKLAAVGQAIENSPADHRQTLWDRVVNSDPRFKGALDKHLPVEVRSDPIVGARYFQALARGYRDPLDEKKVRASIDLTNAQTGQAVAHGRLFDAQATASTQKAPNDTFDLAEGHTRFQQVRRPDGTVDVRKVAEGGQKQDATTKKAIDEADDFVLQSQGALNILKEARQLNDVAYDGTAASSRATIVNNIPFTGGGTVNSNATTRLENLIMNQALQSLRATFGAAPTEGERKILIDVQGSVSLPAHIRAGIYKNAQDLVEKRLAFNKQKSSSLRSGTYYQPDGVPAILSAPQSSDATGPRQAPTTSPVKSPQIPQGAIDLLRSNPTPQAVKQFEDVFGAGSAAHVVRR